jgi:SOS-response transcriptional repressor LexA
MYEEARFWLKSLAEEEGGANSLARRMETSSQKMRRALDGENDPSASSFISWLEGAGAQIVYPGEDARKLRLVPIQMAGPELGAGSSFFYDEDEIETGKFYTFRQDFIDRLGAAKSSLRLFRVRGASMEPDILPKDVVLVQLKEDIQMRDGDTLVVRTGNELLIKFLFKRPDGGILLRSRNKDWPEMTVYPGTDDFQIVGIPRWIGRELS